MAELGHKDLSGRVIEAAIAVHALLGPGFIESVNENALCVELPLAGFHSDSKRSFKSSTVESRSVSTGSTCSWKEFCSSNSRP